MSELPGTRVTALALIAVLAAGGALGAPPAPAALVAAGDRHYAARSRLTGTVWEAVPAEVEAALDSYRAALAADSANLDAGIGLMRTLEFKGSQESDAFPCQPVYAEAVRTGTSLEEAGAPPAHLSYWLAVSWGRWGECHGRLKAAREGMADKVRKYAEKAIALDPGYQGAGPLIVLGRLHYEAPYIPLLLTWPSDKKAEACLRRALGLFPDNKNAALFLAELLQHDGRRDEAVAVLQAALAYPVDPVRGLEDSRLAGRMRALLATLTH